MAGDELFKRYLEIGASVVGMTRERAESIVKDLVASGEVARSQATKAADWLVERGRTGTEELAEVVRREIRQQVTAMGLATKDDIARLEAQLEEYRAAGAGGSPSAKEPARRPRKAQTATAAAPDGDAAGTQSAGNQSAGTQSTATKSPATKSAASKSAGISRSGSVRKAAGAAKSGAADPGAAPPAGGAEPSKG